MSVLGRGKAVVLPNRHETVDSRVLPVVFAG